MPLHPLPARPSAAHRAGRLTTRPRATDAMAAPGLYALDLDPAREGYIYVPDDRRAGGPVPLVLVLHGAGGQAHHGLDLLRDLADARGLVLVAPASRGPTWDVIRGGYGPDVARIDRALAIAFQRCDVDPARVAIAGFSDGASYALSLGITNGDLFRRILAFSPGFAAPGEPHGRPVIHIAHGTDDRVLPIAPCSRTLVPRLRQAGYEVVYREFEGGHMVPPEIAAEAVDALLAGPPAVRPPGPGRRMDGPRV